MSVLWQNSLEQSKQEFVIGNQEDDTFAYIWSRKGRAFRDTVSIRSPGMGGWNTTHTYEVLMRLAQEKFDPQISGSLQKHSINVQDWYGVRHQYSHGTDNNHLLVSHASSSDGIVLGISNKTNTDVHAVEILRSQIGNTVFEILLNLKEAIREDNHKNGHWYDALLRRE